MGGRGAHYLSRTQVLSNPYMRKAPGVGKVQPVVAPLARSWEVALHNTLDQVAVGPRIGSPNPDSCNAAVRHGSTVLGLGRPGLPIGALRCSPWSGHYDIRGLYGEQIDAEVAYRVGRAFVRVLAEGGGRRALGAARGPRARHAPLGAGVRRPIRRRAARRGRRRARRGRGGHGDAPTSPSARATWTGGSCAPPPTTPRPTRAPSSSNAGPSRSPVTRASPRSGAPWRPGNRARPPTPAASSRTRTWATTSGRPRRAGSARTP
jgi:hypothetical protein